MIVLLYVLCIYMHGEINWWVIDWWNQLLRCRIHRVHTPARGGYKTVKYICMLRSCITVYCCLYDPSAWWPFIVEFMIIIIFTVRCGIFYGSYSDIGIRFIGFVLESESIVLHQSDSWLKFSKVELWLGLESRYARLELSSVWDLWDSDRNSLCYAIGLYTNKENF